MKRFIQTIITPVVAALLLALPAAALVAVPAHAQGVSQGVCDGMTLTDPEGADCDDDGEGFGSMARTIINVFSIVVGAISVIMIIVGGFRYIISGGDSNGVTGAKNTIMYAIIGLVIVLFAQVIVRFVFSQTQQDA